MFNLHRNAETLPIWTCYQALVLTTHLPLLNVNMPGSSAIVLSEAAKALRLDHFQTERIWKEFFEIGNSN